MNPHNSPVAYYLTIGRREIVAEKLNRLILTFDGWSNLSSLENLTRQLVCVRDVLHSEKDKKVKTFRTEPRLYILNGI